MCDGLDNDGNGKIDEACPDSDKDTVAGAIDNCPLTPNADQADSGADLLGDVCRLPQVTDLAAAPDSKGGIVLNWKASTADVHGFTVYRTPFGGNPNYLGGYPTATQPYYVDQAGLAAGRYCVLAVSLAGVETGEAWVDVGQRLTLLPMIVR